MKKRKHQSRIDNGLITSLNIFDEFVRHGETSFANQQTTLKIFNLKVIRYLLANIHQVIKLN